jgi:hypothetical protein
MKRLINMRKQKERESYPQILIDSNLDCNNNNNESETAALRYLRNNFQSRTSLESFDAEQEEIECKSREAPESPKIIEQSKVPIGRARNARMMSEGKDYTIRKGSSSRESLSNPRSANRSGSNSNGRTS